MRHYLRICASLLIGGLIVGVCHAEAGIYDELEVRSRAKREFTGNGTVLYNYTDVNEYDESMSPEELGNLSLDQRSRVRRVYNWTEVDTDIRARDQDVEIGTVEIRRRGSVEILENNVEMDGNIRVQGGDAEIGEIRLDENAHLRRLFNSVNIEGDVYAR